MYMYLFTYCIFNSIFKYLPLTSWLANTANWPQTKMNKPKQNIKKTNRYNDLVKIQSD